MTIGSAALLPGTQPQAPLPSFPSFRRGPRPAVMPALGATPARRLPLAGLADDLPRGRILVVADEAPVALEVQHVLREAGYRVVGPAASLDEAERLMARRIVDGAVVDRQLRGDAARDVADGLAQRAIPVVWLTEDTDDLPTDVPADAPAVARSAVREDLVDALERAMSHGSGRGGESRYPVPPPQAVWPRVFPSL